MVTGSISGTNSPKPQAINSAMPTWWVTFHLSSTLTRTPPVPARLLRDKPSTFLFNSGSAATPALPSPSSP